MLLFCVSLSTIDLIPSKLSALLNFIDAFLSSFTWPSAALDSRTDKVAAIDMQLVYRKLRYGVGNFTAFAVVIMSVKANLQQHL